MIGHLTVAALALVCLISIGSPAWSLAFIMTMYAFEQAAQASNPLFVRFLPLVNFLVAASAGLAILRQLLAVPRLLQGYANFVLWGVMAIYAYSAASLLWTPSLGLAVPLVMGQLPYLVLFVMMAPLLIDDAHSVTRFVRSFLFMGVAVVVLMLMNPAFTFYSGRLGFNLDSTVRTNPLAMGELGGNLMLAGALFRVGSRQWFTQLLRGGAFFLGAMLALQSGSRGQVVFAVLLALTFYPVSVRIQNVKGFLWSALGVVVLVPLMLYLGQLLLAGQELRRWDADVIAGGTDVRIANITELVWAWLKAPAAWLFGLGFNAFTSISAARSEPYSHAMTVDMLTEQGIPMFGLFVAVTVVGIRDGIWLFRRFAGDPDVRATLAVVFAMFAYQMLLVNKQGYLWVGMSYFFFLIVASRLRQRTEVFDAEDEAAEADEGDTVHDGHDSDGGDADQGLAPVR